MKHDNLLKNHIPRSKYQFEILTEPYIDQVVEVFTTAFCRSEPMTQYLKMNEEKYKIFARAVTEQAVADGISIIALDGKKVIACALNEDIAAPGPIPDFDPKFVYILGLLEKLGESFFSGKSFERGHLAHLFITAVHEDYRHQGLSTQVNFYAMDLAANRGFQFMYCELTHMYNEFGILHHLKNPKQLIGNIAYKKFAMNGVYPFGNLEGGAHSFLWAIQDNVKLVYKENEERKEHALLSEV